jgi:hypothetical protein
MTSFTTPDNEFIVEGIAHLSIWLDRSMVVELVSIELKKILAIYTVASVTLANAFAAAFLNANVTQPTGVVIL